MWRTLNDAPLFHCTETNSSESPRWSYHIPDPATRPTPPLLAALSKLQSSVTHAVSEQPPHRFQHTLQALIDFTGYLTTKTYALASAMHRLPGATPSPATTVIEEEEIRMEIKALKGLVLNRSVSFSFHTRRLIDLPNPIHTLTLAALLLQENVHSGYCSALECTDRPSPVIPRLDDSHL
jgi:hypothetical protein